MPVTKAQTTWSMCCGLRPHVGPGGGDKCILHALWVIMFAHAYIPTHAEGELSNSLFFFCFLLVTSPVLIVLRTCAQPGRWMPCDCETVFWRIIIIFFGWELSFGALLLYKYSIYTPNDIYYLQYMLSIRAAHPAHSSRPVTG